MLQENHLRILYIAGYGRSGSTLIERLLATDRRILGGGEIANLLLMLLFPERATVPVLRCSCGARLEECPVWGGIVRRLQDLPRSRLWLYLAAQRAMESLVGHTLQLFRWPGITRIYQEFTQMVFSHLFRFRHQVVIDSSKTIRLYAFRPWALARWSGYKVYVLHLVRDGRGCMWSNLRGDNVKMERGLSDARRPAAALRTTLSWPLANWAARKFGEQFPDMYHLLRFEDFLHSPETALESLARFLNMELSEPLQWLTRMRSGRVEVPRTHQIAGNRLRFQSCLQWNPPDPWQRHLPTQYKRFFWYFAGWEARHYGYTHK